MSRPTSPSYKTKNWPAYNDALKQRGSLTVWFDPEMVWTPPPTGKRGRVVWVWRYQEGRRQAVPVRKPFIGDDALRKARFFGATPDAITHWLRSE